MAFSYKSYSESDAVKDARNKVQEHEANKVADWTGGTYGTALQDAMDKIQNREKFTYDLNGDALYNQYKDQYTRLGKMAMLDATGQAAAMTGGYGNSYAQTVGNQAYQSYLQNLNDVVPELYNIALNKYNDESTDLYNQYSLYDDAYNNEYGRYRDNVSDWNTEYSRLQDAYNTEREYDYSLYSDAYSRAFAEYQQMIAEQQAASSGGGGYYGTGDDDTGSKTTYDTTLKSSFDSVKQRMLKASLSTATDLLTVYRQNGTFTAAQLNELAKIVASKSTLQRTNQGTIVDRSNNKVYKVSDAQSRTKTLAEKVLNK